MRQGYQTNRIPILRMVINQSKDKHHFIPAAALPREFPICPLKRNRIGHSRPQWINSSRCRECLDLLDSRVMFRVCGKGPTDVRCDGCSLIPPRGHRCGSAGRISSQNPTKIALSIPMIHCIVPHQTICADRIISHISTTTRVDRRLDHPSSAILRVFRRIRRVFIQSHVSLFE